MIGNQSLYLYKDFLPNTDNGTYFRFTNINDYINYINTNYGINEVLETISLIITIIGGIITFIITPLFSWYNKSKADDKIDNNEVQEAIKIISNGTEKIKNQVDNNEKGKK